MKNELAGNQEQKTVTRQSSDDDVYLMVMLHKYRRKNCNQLARRFGISPGQAYEILAKRSVGGCCG